MKYKPGVRYRGLHWRMRKVLIAADDIWARHGKEAVMTAGLDGEHLATSWHYFGCAVDLRTRYFSREVAKDIADELRSTLGAPYQVILHANSHIHVEFDPVAFNLDQ